MKNKEANGKVNLKRLSCNEIFKKKMSLWMKRVDMFLVLQSPKHDSFVHGRGVLSQGVKLKMFSYYQILGEETLLMVPMPCYTCHWCESLGLFFRTLVCFGTIIINNITITVQYGIFFYPTMFYVSWRLVLNITMLFNMLKCEFFCLTVLWCVCEHFEETKNVIFGFMKLTGA